MIQPRGGRCGLKAGLAGVAACHLDLLVIEALESLQIPFPPDQHHVARLVPTRPPIRSTSGATLSTVKAFQDVGRNLPIQFVARVETHRSQSPNRISP